jgi:hypothetical protein
MLQWIFAHNLFQDETIISYPGKFGIGLNGDTRFENIIHSGSKPSFLIGCEHQVVLLAPRSGNARLENGAPYPDITEVVSIRVPQNYEDVVQGSSVFDVEADSWLDNACPFMVFDGHILLEHIDLPAARERKKDQCQ